jgi:hypothetical protein
MRKARFTEERMVAIIREADREPVPAAAKRHGISEQAIHTWRKWFGGLFDRCATGQQLKCLTVTDEFSKEWLAIVWMAAFVRLA